MSTIQKIRNIALSKLYDPRFSMGVPSISKKKGVYDTGEARKISVAIPHYNRSDIILVTLHNIFQDDRVSEIVILDDGSSDEVFNELKVILEPYRSKVKLFRRNVNLGAFPTKVQVCSLCSNDWAILLDSDNTIYENYLEHVFSLYWDDKSIYCPSCAFPYFDYRIFNGLNFKLDVIKNLKTLKLQDSSNLFPTFINTGNYFLNTKVFSGIMTPYLDFQVHAADVIFANYIWLSSGNNLSVMPDTSYYHRVHARSTWRKTSADSFPVAVALLERFNQEEKASHDVLSKILNRNATLSSNLLDLIPM